MPPVPTYRDSREASEETFKRIPGWFLDRAVLVEERKPATSERTIPFDDDVQIRRSVTFFHSGGRCYRKTVYEFFRYFQTLRSGTKCFRLQEREGDYLFVLGYLRTLEEIARRGLADAIRAAAPDARATLVKAVVSAINSKLPVPVDATEMANAVVRAADTFDDLATSIREVDLLLDWLGKRVAQWVETDYLVEIFPRSVGRRTYIEDVECDEDGLILGLPEGQEDFMESGVLVLDDERQGALKPLLDPSAELPRPEVDRRLRELLDAIERDAKARGRPAKGGYEGEDAPG